MVNPAAPDYGQCSNRFSALAQEWIFLALVNHQNRFIWDYFYRDTGVRAAHTDLTGDYWAFLPIILKIEPPAPDPILVADFDSCSSTNNLGGAMGAAYNLPDRLVESYVQEPGRGCIARLEYHIVCWSAFWMKLEHLDLSQHNRLVFDIKANPQVGIPAEFKIELKRDGNNEISIIYVSGVTADWQTISVDLANFGPAGYGEPIEVFTDMEELVFTFEANHSGTHGVVYLDNIMFEY
jgi:hypothetical protein